MARTNRIVVNDGVYHLTTRIANRDFLFADDKLKDRIVSWMYGIASFSGVELLSWCVMENHLHILVHVPPVPEEYWTDPADPPSSAFFSLRPGACTPRRWFPAGDCPQSSGPQVSGDCPQSSVGDCPPDPRPPVGFRLTDERMLSRLAGLYGAKRAAEIGRNWERRRSLGLGDAVEAEKERYCRRMYNVSQFAKTLKERIAMHYNRATGHEGRLFGDRFHSVLVDRDVKSYAMVSAYIAANPVKARIARTASGWRWSSFAVACGDGPGAEACRSAYCRMFGCDWPDARARLESALGDFLPEGYDAEHPSFMQDGPDGSRIPLRVTQAIWLKLRAFTSGGFLSRDMDFAREAVAKLPKGFRHAGTGSVEFCARLDWSRLAA